MEYNRLRACPKNANLLRYNFGITRQINLDTFLTTHPAAIGYPRSYDLRNVGGKNFITPVKDQDACGNGVVFDVVAAVEGTFKKQRNNPNLDLDYSEAHLFYCYARDEGYTCLTGWGLPDKPLDKIRDKGVLDEACFPYTAGDQVCNLCLDWRKICNDNDNIFFDMLTQLIAAKAGNQRVDFYQEKKVIKEIYVL